MDLISPLQIIGTNKMRDYNFWTAQEFNKLIQECNKYTDKKQRISWSNVQRLFPSKTKDQIKSQYFNFKNNVKSQGKSSKYKRIANQISQDSVSFSASDSTGSMNIQQSLAKENNVQYLEYDSSISEDINDFKDYFNCIQEMDVNIIV